MITLYSSFFRFFRRGTFFPGPFQLGAAYLPFPQLLLTFPIFFRTKPFRITRAPGTMGVTGSRSDGHRQGSRRHVYPDRLNGVATSRGGSLRDRSRRGGRWPGSYRFLVNQLRILAPVPFRVPPTHRVTHRDNRQFPRSRTRRHHRRRRNTKRCFKRMVVDNVVKGVDSYKNGRGPSRAARNVTRQLLPYRPSSNRRRDRDGDRGANSDRLVATISRNGRLKQRCDVSHLP